MDATSRSVKYNTAKDIIISLEPTGKGTLDNKGLVDNRLFNGENQLHAIQDTGLWYLKYDAGVLPQPLKQRFTSWDRLLNFCIDYFGRRNIRIKEIID